VRTKNVITPIPTVGIASAMYMTCQPRRPNGHPGREVPSISARRPPPSLERKTHWPRCAFTGVARSATLSSISTLVPQACRCEGVDKNIPTRQLRFARERGR
jgi:hypothetical protein